MPVASSVVWSIGLNQLLFLADRAHVAEAQRLIADMGGAAALEADRLARRSRDLGNHIHFCRWRQVARLIDLLAADRAVGTIH